MYSSLMHPGPQACLVSVLRGARYPAVKQPGHEGDHSLSNAGVKNEWSSTSSPPYGFVACTGDL